MKINETIKNIKSICDGHKAQSHTAFIKFLEKTETEYGDIKLHCKVRC